MPYNLSRLAGQSAVLVPCPPLLVLCAPALADKPSAACPFAPFFRQVLHERIRSGVMLRRQPTAKQQARQQKLARKAERKARIKQDNEEYQERQQAKRERLKGKRQGSRRGAAVEAQWGSTRGQYKE